jgi:hypothetical protein
MKPDKDTTIGCLLIAMAFLAVTVGLPWASSVISFGGSRAIFAWVFIAIVLIIAMIAIPDLMLFWIALLVVPILLAWVFGDSGSSACVLIAGTGNCE